MRRALVVWATAPLLTGCGLLYQVGAGGVTSTEGRAGRTGVEVQGHAGWGWGGSDFASGFGSSARLRVTEGVQQLAGGFHWFASVFVDGPSPYVRAGAHLLQFERVHSEFGFGMWSPFVELGVTVLDGRKAAKSFFGAGPWVGLWLGHDTRLTRHPSETSAGVTFGWGLGGGADGL